MAIYTSTVIKDNFEVFVLCLSFSIFCYFILRRLHSFDSCSFKLSFRLRLTWKTNHSLINYNALLNALSLVTLYKNSSVWSGPFVTFQMSLSCRHVHQRASSPLNFSHDFISKQRLEEKKRRRKKSKTWIEVCVAELSWPLTFHLVTFRRGSTPRLETTRIKNFTECEAGSTLAPVKATV